MKVRSRIACAVLLIAAAGPALALQLGQIQVKSGLDQPLVAAIPLHPKSLTELKGLTVRLASAADFKKAGLPLTAADRTLRFQVTANDNGQKLILVTSSQPITDPYLDFLIAVNTRRGRQVREFVALLNPVIAASGPTVQSAPVTGANPDRTQPAERPAPKSFAQSKAQGPPPSASANPIGASPPALALQSLPSSQSPSVVSRQSGPVHVQYGDTLYQISSQLVGSGKVTINQMMLALKAANPDAFFKDNIDDLKAGAILRIPTRDQIDQRTIAEANAEVHRQYQAWRAARPHPATLLAGSAERAAAKAAPQPAKTQPTSAHLTLVPPTAKGSGDENRPGVTGGTGSATVAGLSQRLRNDRGTLVSLGQANADLESRVESLKDIAAKGTKLLSFKGATVAELQRKLAALQAPGSSVGGMAAASPAAVARDVDDASSAAGARPSASAKPPQQPRARAWYDGPAAWITLIVIALVVIGLIVVGVFRRKHPLAPRSRGPLPDPKDIPAAAGDIPVNTAADDDALYAQLAERPGDLCAHLQLCRRYYTRSDRDGFVEAAEAMHEEVADPDCVEWGEVLVMGGALVPNHRLFVRQPTAEEDARYRMEALWGTGDAAVGDEAGDLRPSVDASLDMPYVDVPIEEPQEDALASVVTPGALPIGETRDTGLSVQEFSDVTAERDTSEMAPSAAGLAGLPPDGPIPESGKTAFGDDPAGTRLDLARAYLDIGDRSGARTMLEQVLGQGSKAQKDEAKRLLAEAGVLD